MPRESVFTARFKREVPRESVFTGWFKGKVPRESVFIGHFKGEGPRRSVKDLGSEKPSPEKVKFGKHCLSPITLTLRVFIS